MRKNREEEGVVLIGITDHYLRGEAICMCKLYVRADPAGEGYKDLWSAGMARRAF